LFVERSPLTRRLLPLAASSLAGEPNLLGDIEFVVIEFFATGSQVPLLLVIADI
jgi:hypothetical protein